MKKSFPTNRQTKNNLIIDNISPKQSIKELCYRWNIYILVNVQKSCVTDEKSELETH